MGSRVEGTGPAEHKDTPDVTQLVELSPCGANGLAVLEMTQLRLDDEQQERRPARARLLGLVRIGEVEAPLVVVRVPLDKALHVILELAHVLLEQIVEHTHIEADEHGDPHAA